jgi:serine protease Do
MPMIVVALLLCGIASADPPPRRRSAIAVAVEKANPSIVTIVASNGANRNSVAAAVVDAKGLLLAPTAMIAANDTIIVIANDDSRLAAKLLHVDEKIGVSVFRIVGEKLPPPLEFAETDKLEIGESLIVLGRTSPEANSRVAVQSILSAKQRMVQGEQLLQIDSSIGPGNPSGVVIDIDGKFVGLATKAGGIQFVAPNDRLKRLLEKLPK